MTGKVIIFGATGKVGCYTALYLKEQGWDVVASGRRASDGGFFADYGIPYVSVDIMDKSRFAALPSENVFAVINMAAVLPATMEGYDPHVYVDDIHGAMNVLEYAVSAGVERFIFPTTVADVSYLFESGRPIPADAERRFPLNSDHSVYAITRNASVDILRHFSAKYGFRHYVLRFQNVFCYHPNPTFHKDGVKRWTGQRAIIEDAKAGRDIEIWGDPERGRDVFYVKDCTQIIGKCLSSDAESGIYNVGSGKMVSRREQVEGIIKVWAPEGSHPSIIVRSDKPDSTNYRLDISKTVEKLGYRPQYDYMKYLLDLKKEMEQNRFEKLWGRESDYTEGLC